MTSTFGTTTPKDMKADKEHTRLMKAAINSDDANTKKTAIDAITSWGVDSVVELGLKDDVGVKAAFDKMGIDISAIDVSWDDVSLDDAEKVTKYVNAGHPKAVAYVDAVIQEALKTNSTNTDKLAAILPLVS